MPWRKGNRLRLVTEPEAQGTTADIYQDIRSTLGLPLVPTSFQALAGMPEFLALAWSELRPLARTQEFFTLSERLRADAYTRCYSYFSVPDLHVRCETMGFSRGACEEVSASIDLLNHGGAMVLLLLAVLVQSFEGPVGQDAPCERPAVRPVYEVRPALLNEDTAPPDVQRIFEDVRRTLKIPQLTAEMRALARWPHLFTDYWQALKKSIDSPLYEVCFRGVHDTAFTLTREIPVVVDLTTERLTEAGLSEDDIGSVLRITDSFVHAMVGTVLNAAFAKIGIEGGNKAPVVASEQVAS